MGKCEAEIADASLCSRTCHLLALAVLRMSAHLSKKTRATITQAQKLTRRLRSVALREELDTTVAAYHDSARKIAAKHARYVTFVIHYSLLHQPSHYIVPVHWGLSAASYTCQSRGHVRRQAGMVSFKNKLRSITMVSSLSICSYNLSPLNMDLCRSSTRKPHETEPVHEGKSYRPT